jgi:hypothetical protein
MSMILLEPAYKILHATGEVQAADHLSNAVFRIHRTRLIPVRGENPQIEEGTWVAPARSCRAGRDQRKLRLSNIADILNKTIKAIKIKGSMDVLREICVVEKISDLGPILVKIIGCF